MFGWPLFIFLVSPLIDVPPISGEYRRIFGHWTAGAGTGLSIAGLVLVAAGWIRIHRASGLVTEGIYRYMRHPQYTGMFLFTFGWIVHWPSVATLMLWPVLMAAYGWLSLREERQAREEFGAPYADYAARTKRFVPFLI
jgi:protein-S-isoprenylcysteine O-methyltransferase Ste14